ncbi:hypothetical protein ACO0LO_15170 [Undibacterium sp. TJN25]|uniref:hypothetical protein n=1 Tax=Undibacterium sp. TJN25 TaxID=3413056 RepID=UPI003BF168F3
MIITKQLSNSVVRLCTTAYANGWTLRVEVDGQLVRDPDHDLFLSEDDALRAGDMCAMRVITLFE